MQRTRDHSYHVDIKDYEKEQILNNSEFNKIFLITNDHTKQRSVAKVYIGAKTNDDIKESLKNEIGVLIRVEAPTIIKFYGYSLYDFDGLPNPTIFTEYKDNGSLQQLISKLQQNERPSNFDNTAKQILLCGIAHGMMILHSKRILHRNLKTSNILLDSKFRPCISDFGVSQSIQQDNNQGHRIMHHISQYVAPEFLNGGAYSTKADVYSFGIIMYEVLTGQFAFQSEFRKKHFSLIRFCKHLNTHRPPFPENPPIKDSFKHLIDLCWSSDPRKRPSFREIFQRLSLSLEADDDSITDQVSGILEDGEFDYYRNCLDGVDIHQLLDYVEEITAREARISRIVDENDKRLNQLEQTVQDLTSKHQISKQLSNIPTDPEAPLPKPSQPRVSES